MGMTRPSAHQRFALLGYILCDYRGDICEVLSNSTRCFRSNTVVTVVGGRGDRITYTRMASIDVMRK